MSKQIKIVKHSFNNEGAKRVVLRTQAKTIEDLKLEIKNLEEQLKRIIRLAETLDYIEDENRMSSDTEGSITYDKVKVNKLKKYLKWALNILRNSKRLKQNNIEDKNQYLGNMFIKNFNCMEETLTQDIFYKAHSALSIRNRAGRTAEHVGNDVNMFDYGSFLEHSLSFRDCFFYGSGFYFYPKEIINHVKQANPGFLSKAIMACISLHIVSLPGYDFKEIINCVLNDIVLLIPQACSRISFENLKALAMLYDISLTQNIFSLSNRLLSMAIRMAYSLGINKIQLNNKKISFAYNEEYKQQVELKKLWFWLSIAASTYPNLNESPSLLNSFTITESDLIKFDGLRDLEATRMIKSNLSYSGCKSPSGLITNQATMILSTILGHLQANVPTNGKVNQVPYSKICLPDDKFNEIQAFIDTYNIFSPTFIYDIMKRQSRNEAIEIEHYLCRIPDEYTCRLKIVHEIKKSLSLYTYQIFLIYPIALRTPYQVDIPLFKLITILEVSLKLLLIYRVIAYIYFETLLAQMIPSLSGEQSIYEDVTDYLSARPRPLVKGKNEYYFYLMRVYPFKGSLYAFYALLQVLSSQEYYNSGLASNESITVIKKNIVELFEIYKLGFKLKDDLPRMDIDFTINRVKQVIQHFQIIPEYQIDWSVLLEGVGS